MKLSSLFVVVVMTSVLAACGGGGDTAIPGSVMTTPTPKPTAPILIDKYTATWKSCRSDGLSRTIVITKKSENTYAGAFKVTAHNGGYPCAGEGTAVPDRSGTGEFKIVGTKEVLGSTAGTVDKIIDSVDGDKNIFFIKDGVTVTDSAAPVTVLYYGDVTRTLDSDGFPDFLDTLQPFRKQ
jgi:hypothetical protein